MQSPQQRGSTTTAELLIRDRVRQRLLTRVQYRCEVSLMMLVLLGQQLRIRDEQRFPLRQNPPVRRVIEM